MHDPCEDDEDPDQFPDSLTTYESDLNEALEQATNPGEDEE
jgi:hypothetical protein